MATQFGHAFTAELTAKDVKAFSKALEVFQGIRQRRKVAKIAEEAAASHVIVADAEADGAGQAVAAAAETEAIGDVDRSEGGEGGGNAKEKEDAKWNLEKEVDLLSKARTREKERMSCFGRSLVVIVGFGVVRVVVVVVGRRVRRDYVCCAERLQPWKANQPRPWLLSFGFNPSSRLHAKAQAPLHSILVHTVESPTETPGESVGLPFHFVIQLTHPPHTPHPISLALQQPLPTSSCASWHHLTTMSIAITGPRGV